MRTFCARLAMALLGLMLAVSLSACAELLPPEQSSASRPTSHATRTPAKRAPSSRAPAPQSPSELWSIVIQAAGAPGAANTFWRREIGSRWTVPRIVLYSDGQVPRVACGRSE